MVSLQRLSLTLDKMGEANESIISYEDLLSTALGESGLDLDDLFGNVPGNVLSQATLRTLTLPTIVIAHTFCASPDTRISYRHCLLI